MSGLAGVRGAGLSDRLVDAEDLLVPKPEWNRLARMNAIVGECRNCGGDLVPMASDAHDTSGEDGAISWYDATCRSCRRDVGSPNGRVLRRSSLHGEMPPGWLAIREKRDAEELAARTGSEK